MRTTLDIPPDLHGLLHALAHSSRKSLSQTATDLMRRGLAPSQAAARGAPVVSTHKATGLPMVRMPRAITAEDVRQLDDEG